jgi:HEPN domain-containing protein
MKPHVEEARRSLRLADRDIKAFEILRGEPEAHLSIICFHAQQAVEKSLKAVLFLHQIEFERTHDLVKLARLLGAEGIPVPTHEDELRRLNPFSVTFRYDDLETELISAEHTATLVTLIRRWAGEQMSAAAEGLEPEGTANG